MEFYTCLVETKELRYMNEHWRHKFYYICVLVLYCSELHAEKNKNVVAIESGRFTLIILLTQFGYWTFIKIYCC